MFMHRSSNLDTMFPYQRSLTYKYTDAYNTLLPIPYLLKVFKEPIYLSYILLYVI